MAFSNAILAEPNTLYFVFPIGMLGFFVLVFFMPLRIIWVIYKYLRYKNKGVTDKGSFQFANILLFIATYATFEFLYTFSKVGSGGVSGLMLPMYSFLPFMFYIFFEIFRAKAFRNRRED